MKDTPLISILMPAYNAGIYLREAIEGVLRQTYTNFEFIILNDGSTDDTEKIINSYRDSRIVYVKNEVNLRLIKTLNKGIDLAKGEYIARMDADDIALPQWLENAMQGFQDAPYAAVVNQRDYEMNDEGTLYWKRPFMVYLNNECLRYTQLFATQILHPGIVVRGDVLQKYRYRDVPEALHCEDFDLWRRIVKDNLFIKVLDSYAVYHRKAPGSITATQSTNSELRREVLRQDLLEEGYTLKENTIKFLISKECCNVTSGITAYKDMYTLMTYLKKKHNIQSSDAARIHLWLKCQILQHSLQKSKSPKGLCAFITLITIQGWILAPWFWKKMIGRVWIVKYKIQK